MSIANGNPTLFSEVNQNQKRNNRPNINNKDNKDNNKKNKRYFSEDESQQRRKPFNNRSFDKYEDYSFNLSTYFPEEERGVTVEQEPEDDRADKVIDFCEKFSDSIDNYRSLQTVIIEDFPDIVPFTKRYYSSRNTTSFQDSLNRLIKLMCTTQFANTLSSVLESGVWSEDSTYTEIWDSIGFAISIALETNHERMHVDTIRKYVSGIIPRLYKPEINSIVSETGITKDLALDLVIALPITTNDWNSTTIDTFYHRFLDKMIDHAEDNIDILNWEIQGLLYDRFFGGNKSKTALKVIGKFLTSKPLPEMDSDVANAVYSEFQKMIYSKLDRYDINDIEYVFNFVYRKRKEDNDNNTMFNSVIASKFDNVRKGLLSIMDKDPESMNYLA